MKTKIFQSMDACYEYFGEDLQIPSDTIVIVHDTDNPNEIYSTIIPYNGQNIILKGASITSIPREGAFEHITVIHPITGEEVEYTYVSDEDEPDEPEDPTTTEEPEVYHPIVVSTSFGHSQEDESDTFEADASGYITEYDENTEEDVAVAYYAILDSTYADGYVFNIIYGDPDEETGEYNQKSIQAYGDEEVQTEAVDFNGYSVVQVRLNIPSENITRSDGTVRIEYLFKDSEVKIYCIDKEGEFEEDPEDPQDPQDNSTYNAANVYLINSDDEREAVNLSTEALADLKLVVSAEALGKTVEELEEMGYAETGEEIGMVKVTEDEAATNEDDYYAAYTIIAKPESDPIDGAYTFEIELNNPDSNVFTDEISDAGNVHEFNNDYTEGAGATHFTFGLEYAGIVNKGFKFTVPEDYHFPIEIFYNPEDYTFTFTEYGYQPDNGSEEE